MHILAILQILPANTWRKHMVLVRLLLRILFRIGRRWLATILLIIPMTTLSDSFCLIDFSDLRFNRIRHIPRGTFQNLTQLNTLLLNNNQLRRLRNGAFVGLVNLQYLYLYKNQIHLIESNVFDDVPNLEHLYLHFNQIKVISPKLFQGMSNLHRLWVYNW